MGLIKNFGFYPPDLTYTVSAFEQYSST